MFKVKRPVNPTSTKITDKMPKQRGKGRNVKPNKYENRQSYKSHAGPDDQEEFTTRTNNLHLEESNTEKSNS